MSLIAKLLERDLSDLPAEIIEATRNLNLDKRINVIGKVAFRDQVLEANSIRFGANSTLVVGDASMKWVLIVTKEIILPGGDAKATLRTHRRTPAKAETGRKGKPGPDAVWPDRDGGIGVIGRRGERGVDGDNAPTLVILFDKVTYVTPPTAIDTFQVRAHGSNGGDGGDGGEGGDGGNGMDATPGVIGQLDDFEPITCIVPAIRGGTAGQGGPGRGGRRGGKAGDGAEVWLVGTQDAIDASKRFLISGRAGSPGKGGNGGQGGNPGQPGRAFSSPPPCQFGRIGELNRSGDPGSPGGEGPNGTDVFITNIVTVESVMNLGQ
ncbi:MAG: hypothetical protein QNJ16_10895 [Rhodobacter sp.]|nr:hypothetical protein [Rhodobacter sp.]